MTEQDRWSHDNRKTDVRYATETGPEPNSNGSIRGLFGRGGVDPEQLYPKSDRSGLGVVLPPVDLHLAHLNGVAAVYGAGVGEPGGVETDIASRDGLEFNHAVLHRGDAEGILNGLDGGELLAVHGYPNLVLLGEDVGTLPHTAGDQNHTVHVVDLQQVDGDPLGHVGVFVAEQLGCPGLGGVAVGDVGVVAGPLGDVGGAEGTAEGTHACGVEVDAVDGPDLARIHGQQQTLSSLGGEAGGVGAVHDAVGEVVEVVVFGACSSSAHLSDRTSASDADRLFSFSSIGARSVWGIRPQLRTVG